MKTKIKLNTVNVIEITDGYFQSIHSFADNHKGNQRAEKLFRKLIEEFEKELPEEPLNEASPHSDEEDFQNYLDDGLYEHTGYHVVISHSI